MLLIMAKNYVSALLRVADKECGYKSDIIYEVLPEPEPMKDEDGNIIEQENPDPIPKTVDLEATVSNTKYYKEIYSDYPDFYVTKKNLRFCDVFIDWCFLKAFGYDETNKLSCYPDEVPNDSCVYDYQYFKQAGKVGSEPKIGSIVYFQKGTSSTDLGINHAAIVEYITNSKIHVIEANNNITVSRFVYDKNMPKIYGYGYPEYDTPDNDLNVYLSEMGWAAKQSTNVILASKLSDISFGKLDNLSKVIKARGKCISTVPLNVRTLPGTESPLLQDHSTISKGTQVDIFDKVKDSAGSTWLYIKINNLTFGFVNARYIQII